jgi:hypothetical protein
MDNPWLLNKDLLVDINKSGRLGDVGLDLLIDLEQWWDWGGLWDELIWVGHHNLGKRNGWEWGLSLDSELL